MKLFPVLLLSSVSLVAQSTYRLQGARYTDGMAYTMKASINGLTQSKESNTSEAISMSMRFDVTVEDADEQSGKVVEAYVTYSDDFSLKAGQELIPPEYYNRKLLYRRKWNGWDVSVDGTHIKGKDLETLANLTFCEDASAMPGEMVPIGYKWSVSIAEMFRMMGSGSKELAELAKGTSGNANYQFKSIVNADNQECANIIGNAKVKLNIQNAGTASMKMETQELRRTSNGIMKQLEAKMIMSMTGMEMTMSIHGSCEISN